MTNFSKRPKWAKPLSKRDWFHLRDTFATKRPTLVGFKRNLEHQKISKFGCSECNHIAIVLMDANII